MRLSVLWVLLLLFGGCSITSMSLENRITSYNVCYTKLLRILQTTKLYNENDEVLSVIEQFGRLTDELRSNTMSIRMVPIGTTFSSFKRLVVITSYSIHYTKLYDREEGPEPVQDEGYILVEPPGRPNDDEP